MVNSDMPTIVSATLKVINKKIINNYPNKTKQRKPQNFIMT